MDVHANLLVSTHPCIHPSIDPSMHPSSIHHPFIQPCFSFHMSFLRPWICFMSESYPKDRCWLAPVESELDRLVISGSQWSISVSLLTKYRQSVPTGFGAVVLLWFWLTAQLEAPCGLWRSCPSQPGQLLLLHVGGLPVRLVSLSVRKLPDSFSHWRSFRPSIQRNGCWSTSEHVSLPFFSIQSHKPMLKMDLPVAPHGTARRWMQILCFHVWPTRI